MPRKLPRQLSTPVNFRHPRRFAPCITSSHQLTIIIRKCNISKREAIKYFLNPTTNTTANKSKVLFKVELKEIFGALQMIAYRRPSGRTALQYIMLQSYFYGLNINYSSINYSSCWVKNSTIVFPKIKVISLHLSNKCKKQNKFLEANTNYFDTLQFEANTRRPTPYGMQSRFTTLFQDLYAKPSRRKKNLYLGTYNWTIGDDTVIRDQH
jgi:hypothetical protein